MATYRPGRLRRVLTPIIGTQFAFASVNSDFIDYDDTIQSVVINRGTSSGRNIGYTPNTCEISVEGRRDSFYTGNQMRFSLRETAADSLAAYLGTTGAAIKTRFYGRLGTIGIDDTGTKFSTTVTGSGYLAQMNYSPASFTPTTYQQLADLYLDMTKASEPLRGVQFSTDLGNINIQKYAAGEPTLFRDGLDTFVTDIGVLFQERRNGNVVAYGHTRRKDLAAASLPSSLPLMRHQAIAPGYYEQPNPRPAKRIYYKIRNEGGGIATRMVDVDNPTGELREIDNVDWLEFQLTNLENQAYREAYSRLFESSSRLYNMPTIKIDMLMLLKQNTEYSRGIAKQILELEVSQPVFLSGDWPVRLRGVHFADGIKETLTADSWEFELSLVPHAVATGHISPAVPGRAWDSLLGTWDEETREWDQI